MVHLFMNEFLDHRDNGTAIVSHFYLLTGCAGSLWLETYNGFVTTSFSPLPVLTGFLSIGRRSSYSSRAFSFWAWVTHWYVSIRPACEHGLLTSEPGVHHWETGWDTQMVADYFEDLGRQLGLCCFHHHFRVGIEIVWTGRPFLCA